MERIKEKLSNLRVEADTAIRRAEEAEAKNKKLEQALLERDQEIKSKDHRLDDLEKELEHISHVYKEASAKLHSGDIDAEHNERKLQRAEQERDTWEKKYEEAEKKYRKAQADLEELVVNMDNL
ncbi:actin filament-coating protein tropomyosin [Lactarius pseudohatsudake]|nr:actin filament-coating protein tropomyosin [Lactarius pseudohatsudake]